MFAWLVTGGTGTVSGRLLRAGHRSGARRAAAKKMIGIRTPVCGAPGTAASLSASGVRSAYWCPRTTASAAVTSMTMRKITGNSAARTWTGKPSRFLYLASCRLASFCSTWIRRRRGVYRHVPRRRSLAFAVRCLMPGKQFSRTSCRYKHGQANGNTKGRKLGNKQKHQSSNRTRQGPCKQGKDATSTCSPARARKPKSNGRTTNGTEAPTLGKQALSRSQCGWASVETWKWQMCCSSATVPPAAGRDIGL